MKEELLRSFLFDKMIVKEVVAENRKKRKTKTRGEEGEIIEIKNLLFYFCH